ncbi:hypothetical protein HY478_04100 [Candidatus Uhrbacteria bacterium]|nr:hypothetical protein [Candidatus Uhrbacteria bacterium]
MMRETLRFLASPVTGLQSAVYILAASALSSSLLALVRDRLFAHTFGAGAELDLYYAAFRIPDLLFVATGALVSVYILIPELLRRDSNQQNEYVDTIVIGFSGLATLLCALAALFAPSILIKLFPTLAEGHLGELTALTRIMLLQPILLGLSNILAAITQIRGRYLLYAISPILYNIGIIGGLLILYPILGLPGLAWGVVLGSLLHVGIQIPSVVDDGFLRSVPRFRVPRALLETVSVSIPRALALSMNQVTFIGLLSIASSFATGSIAVFMFAFNLMSVPLAVIGASYSVAAFPTLASALSLGKMAEFIDYVSKAARYVLFWSLPALGLIIVLRAHLVRVVLGSGSFDWTDTRLTAAVFALLSISLAAQGLTLLLTRAYYAAGRTFVPFLIAVVSSIGTILLALYLANLVNAANVLSVVQSAMRLEGVSGSSVIVLGFSYAAISILSTLMLLGHFEWRFPGLIARILEALWQAILAALAAALASYGVLVLVGPLTLSSTLLSVFLRGFAAGLVGLSTAAIVYALLQNREFAETVAGIRAKFWKEPAPPLQPIASAEEISPSSPQ